MKKEERLALLLDGISDEMLLQALDTDNTVAFSRLKHTRHKGLWTALAACLILVLLALTPPGQVVAAQIRNGIETLIQTLFPPKEVVITPEGMEETVTYTAHGQLTPNELLPDGVLSAETVPDGTVPVETAPDEACPPADFIIYVDEDLYTVTETEETFIISPIPISYTREDAIDSISALLEGLSEEEANLLIEEHMAEMTAFYESLPKCSMEIRQISDITPLQAATDMRSDLQDWYINVSEVTENENPQGFYIRADNGTDALSEVAEVFFIDNEKGGTFLITLHYFAEAAEGHGFRFLSMLETFEPVP
ncbi:MAG: hypothetical protein ACI4EQ_10470 [Lachnospiraceae bacterium]